MEDSQILLIVGLLLLVVGILGTALTLFGAEIGALTGPRRLTAVILGLGLLAAWMWLPLPGSRHAAEAAATDAYQRRVLATCADIRNNQPEAGPEIFSPAGLDRDALVSVIDRQLAFQNVAWSQLWQEEPPEQLIDERNRARRHVRSTLRAISRWRELIAKEAQASLSQGRLNQLASRSGALDRAARATASLSDLAGSSCRLTE